MPSSDDELITKSLTEAQLERVNQLFGGSKFTISLLELPNVAVVGGAAVFVLHDETSLESVNDIDLLISESNAVSAGAVLRRFLELGCTVEVRNPQSPHFHLNTKEESRLPVQVIFTSSSLAQVLTEFDLDCVQCAFTATQGLLTQLAQLSHASHRLFRINAGVPHVASRLRRRLINATAKGFWVGDDRQAVCSLLPDDLPLDLHELQVLRESREGWKEALLLNSSSSDDGKKTCANFSLNGSPYECFVLKSVDGGLCLSDGTNRIDSITLTPQPFSALHNYDNEVQCGVKLVRLSRLSCFAGPDGASEIFPSHLVLLGPDEIGHLLPGDRVIRLSTYSLQTARDDKRIRFLSRLKGRSNEWYATTTHINSEAQRKRMQFVVDRTLDYIIRQKYQEAVNGAASDVMKWFGFSGLDVWCYQTFASRDRDDDQRTVDDANGLTKEDKRCLAQVCNILQIRFWSKR